jgi:hypothetical protein
VVDPAELREHIIGTIGDMVSDLLYYNRKEDEDLPVGAIEQAVKDGVITVEELVECFKEEIESLE